MRKFPETFEIKVCVTAQHREMLDQVLEIFGITPDIDLNLMKRGQDLSTLTTEILLGIKQVIESEKPDLVLVHGDTTTTFATSLACFYSDVAIGHVEAGLRTYNINSPFPEEFNRQMVSKVATLNFAPTDLCREALIAEKIDPKSVLVTGNTVIDALKWVIDQVESNDNVRIPLEGELNARLSFNWKATKFVLITGHRRENFGEGFLEICSAISELSQKFPDVHFVYPVHLNPNVQKPVRSILGGISNIHLIEPQGYLHFAVLLQKCYFVLTDSGGIQEEAPSLVKPVLLMRDTTERPEAITAGTISLVGPNKAKIVDGASRLLTNVHSYNEMATSHNPFGDGDASQRIIAAIVNFYGL
jgi:UDP-N-acetylglucosamine 2-epimerase (non-hydrolysing)